MHKAWSVVEEVTKNRQLWCDFSVLGLKFYIVISNEGYEITHKVWNCTERVAYFFRGNPSNLKVIRVDNWRFGSNNFNID